MSGNGNEGEHRFQRDHGSVASRALGDYHHQSLEDIHEHRRMSLFRHIPDVEEDVTSMRVGAEFQAVIPKLESSNAPETAMDENKRMGSSLVIWKPVEDEKKNREVDAFVKLATSSAYGYSVDQALGLLYWYDYNVTKAAKDLETFQPVVDQWSSEDKETFDRGMTYHNKNFRRIRSILNHKSVPALVKYYYTWKKSRRRDAIVSRLLMPAKRETFGAMDTEMEHGKSNRTRSRPTGREKSAPKVNTLKEDGASVKTEVKEGLSVIPDGAENISLRLLPKKMCYHCKTQTSPFWRRGPSKAILCNACGLYWKKHGVFRDIQLIQKSSRGGGSRSFSSLSPSEDNAIPARPAMDLKVLSTIKTPGNEITNKYMDERLVKLKASVKENRQKIACLNDYFKWEENDQASAIYTFTERLSWFREQKEDVFKSYYEEVN
eukprot:Nk52_evm81s270 gene=Nk52_evmTU81s270